MTIGWTFQDMLARNAPFRTRRVGVRCEYGHQSAWTDCLKSELFKFGQKIVQWSGHFHVKWGASKNQILRMVLNSEKNEKS